MSVECPRCLSRVLPSGDGRCPACGLNVHERSGENENLTGLVLRESDKLPPHCPHCDAPTDRVVKIDSDPGNESRAITSGMGRVLWKAVVHLVSLPFGLLVVGSGRRASASRRVQLELPECAACGRLSLTPVRHVDFAHGECTMAIHRGFKHRVLSMNPGPRSAS